MREDDNHESDHEILEPLEHSITEAQKDSVNAGYKILSYRSLAPDVYKSFVYASWLNGLRYGNDFFKLIDKDAYYASYHKYITSVLSRRGSRLRIAVLSEDEDVALGWSLDEGEILHYVFVKEDLRKNGIGRSLVDPKIKTFSHITKIGLSLWNDKMPNLKFNPFV